MSRGSRSDIGAGVVNYNCGGDTARCVRSLLGQTRPPSRILIIDNASLDGSGARLAGEFAAEPSVRVEINRRNLGFGAAQNQAMRAAGGEFYLCVNPDAILRPDYLERLVGALEARPEVGYGTGLIYFCEPDGAPTPYIFSAGHWFLRNRAVLNRYYTHTWPEEMLESGEVGGASGCAVVYRRAMLDAIDLGRGEYFDETYFMYIDDIDMDWRAHLAGWTCWFEKSAVAFHVGETTGGAANPWIYGQLVGNRWLMTLKNDTPANFLLHLPFMLHSDMRFFWPELRRLGGLRFFFDGLGRRLREALRKRKAVRRSACRSSAEIRAWMRESLAEIRAYNRFRLARPDLVRPRPPARGPA